MEQFQSTLFKGFVHRGEEGGGAGSVPCNSLKALNTAGRAGRVEQFPSTLFKGFDYSRKGWGGWINSRQLFEGFD